MEYDSYVDAIVGVIIAGIVFYFATLGVLAVLLTLLTWL